MELQEDGRWAAFPRLPYVGQGWYAKPAVAYMLEKGIATWNDFVRSLDATAHVEQESVTQALQQMAEGEEHCGMLAVVGPVPCYSIVTASGGARRRLSRALIRMRWASS